MKKLTTLFMAFIFIFAISAVAFAEKPAVAPAAKKEAPKVEEQKAAPEVGAAKVEKKEVKKAKKAAKKAKKAKKAEEEKPVEEAPAKEAPVKK